MGPFSVRDALRGVPVAVLPLTVAWVAMLTLWSVVPPMFQAPDEPQHVDMVLDAQRLGPLQWLAPEGNDVDHVVEEAQQRFGYLEPESALVSGAQAGRRTGLSADEAIPRDQRPTYRELFASDGLAGSRQNQMAQHPPLYYRLAGLALSAVPGWQDLSFDVIVGLLRLLSVLLLAPLPLLAARTAVVLGGSPDTAVVAAVMPFTVPQLAHIGSVVSNDPLLITTAGLLSLLCAHVLAGDHSTTTGRWVGGTLLVALLTKGFALVLPVAVVVAYGRQLHRHPAARQALRAPLAWAVGLPALALWWYGENLLRFGSLQPSVLAPPTPAVPGDPVAFLVRAAQVQARTFWGLVGWAEAGLSSRTALVASAVLLVVLAVGAWRRPPAQLAVLLLPGLAITTITLWRAWAAWGQAGVLRGVQGRYGYLSLVGVFVVAAWGLLRLLPARAHRWAWLLPAITATALHLLVGREALSLFWIARPGQDLGDAMWAMLTWAPWSGRLLLGVAVTGGLAALATIGLLATGRGLQSPATGDSEHEGQAAEQQHQRVTTA